jgi:hypothetical protein
VRRSIGPLAKSRSIAYLQWKRHVWKARRLSCQKQLAVDRWSWKRDPAGKAKQIARYLLARQGISGHYSMLAYIIEHESSWNVRADNPTSDAYGIPQALPGSKMASMGADWRTNPETQLKWMIRYCQTRYGGIPGAYRVKLATGVY